MLETALLLAGWMAATDPVVRTVALSDMPPSEALKGAVLRVEKRNGSFNEGLVTSADSTHLVIDSTQDIPAADIAHVVTLRPARFPVAPGAFARVVVRTEGAVYRGIVTDVADDSIAVQSAESEARVRWAAIERIEVEVERRDGIALLQTLARPDPTPGPAATPAPTPEPNPFETPASVPEARGFPLAGTVELGGAFGFSGGSSELTSSASSSYATGHSVAFRPYAGYVVIDGLELLTEGDFSSNVTNYENGGDAWNNRFGFRAGAAYLFGRPDSRATFGPQVLFGFYSAGGEFVQSGVTYEFEERGTSLSAGLGVRVPVGEHALLNIGAGWYRERYTVEIYPGQLVSDYRGAREGFETTVGFSMWLDP